MDVTSRSHDDHLHQCLGRRKDRMNALKGAFPPSALLMMCDVAVGCCLLGAVVRSSLLKITASLEVT